MKRGMIFDFFNELNNSELSYFIELLFAFFPIPEEIDYNSFKSVETLNILMKENPNKWVGLLKTLKKVF